MHIYTLPKYDIDREVKSPLFIETLVNLASLSLNSMYEASTERFCERLSLSANGEPTEPAALRSTLVALLGLHKASQHHLPTSVSIGHLVGNQLDDADDIDSGADYALLIWLCAEALPDGLEKLLDPVPADRLLRQFTDFRKGTTISLSWMLTALLAAADRGYPIEHVTLRTIYDRLRSNFCEGGLFSRADSRHLSGRIRGRTGHFQDQAFSIRALSCYAEAFHDPEALSLARDCAHTIVLLQGELGQWWPHYDATRGTVIGHYPLYSVNQDALAPMALMAIGDALNTDYSTAILHGLEWIAGHNEVAVSMMDEQHTLICDGVRHPRFQRYADAWRAMLHAEAGAQRRASGLRPDRFSSADHMGWILYTFADQMHNSLLSEASPSA